MNISEFDRKELNNANVYQASNGEYFAGQVLNREYLKEYPIGQSYRIEETRKGLKLVIDRSNSHYEEERDRIFKRKGKIIPPDEILDMLKPNDLKIPMVERDSLNGLPNSDLLKSIHYFVSKKLTASEMKRDKKNKFVQSMDETCLLTMGMLIENWVDDLITENACKMYLEHDTEEDEDL